MKRALLIWLMLQLCFSGMTAGEDRWRTIYGHQSESCITREFNPGLAEVYSNVFGFFFPLLTVSLTVVEGLTCADGKR